MPVPRAGLLPAGSTAITLCPSVVFTMSNELHNGEVEGIGISVRTTPVGGENDRRISIGADCSLPIF